MTAKINLGDRKPIFEPIKLEGGGEFEIELRPPSFAALVDDWETSRGYLATRVRECVIGWRGLNDGNDDPIPFAIESFEAVCHQRPEVLTQTLAHLQRVYAGNRTEDQSKNSETPPGGSSGGET